MGQFLEELKRRKVLRVVAAYIVASWVLLQVSELLSSILELPEWSNKFALFALVIGFIPAIILAWAYDVTPEGVRATPDAGGRAAVRTSAPAIFAVVTVTLALGIGGWWYGGKDERWARDVAIPDIEDFVQAGDFELAFSLALRVEAIAPGDPDMAEVWDSFAWTTSIPSSPGGAKVYRRAYSDTEADWQELGITPLHDIHIPFGASLLRIEMDGYEPLLRVIGGGLHNLTLLAVEEKPQAGFANIGPETFKLDAQGSKPAAMVRVPGWGQLLDGKVIDFRDFYLARYEVTNGEFEEFIAAGGYRRRDLWEHEFVKNGEPISFEEAMALFVDKTGRAGPSTWEAGIYTTGEEDFPVGGVSWYEAAAFARFAKRELPTVHHWRRGLAIGILAWQLPASNLDGGKPAAVGAFKGIGWTGTFDMAGNVREWCWNETSDGMRAIVGSAWNDALYLVEETFSTPHRRDALDRSATNGFRLAATNDESAVDIVAALPLIDADIPALAAPVSDEVFAAKLSEFEYDRSPLNAVIEETVAYRHWSRQRITLDSPVDDVRLTLYLYLPERELSRYQVLVYWPGAATQILPSIEQSRMPLDFALRNGRAVAYPVMKGMFERRLQPPPNWTTHKGRDLAIEQVVEFRRAIDYLATRPDMDIEKLAYYGISWGGRMGGMVLSVEPRIKVGVLDQAGINATDHPDINMVHFLPRVRVPVLQFNGRYDTDFRFDSSAKPFFDALGTAAADKKHVVEPTGHFVSPAITRGETLDWLDKYLGPVD